MRLTRRQNQYPSKTSSPAAPTKLTAILMPVLALKIKPGAGVKVGICAGEIVGFDDGSGVGVLF